jgi:hypothetical protein
MMAAGARSTSEPRRGSSASGGTEMASKHVTLIKEKDHKKQDGCVNKHEPGFDGPTYPQCAYRPNGYQATLTEFVKGMVPPMSKRSLYEHDFTEEKPAGTPLQNNHRGRLPVNMETFKSTGRQPKAEKQMGTLRRIYTNRDPRTNPKAWHLENGDNYKVFHLPFGHEYHHIMPEEAISEALTLEEAKILQAAGYNINHGKNMIILPITRDVAYALMLPKHKGWHSSYNQECMGILNRLKRSANKASTTHAITEENVGGVRQNLETWQENQYKILVNYGRAVAMSQGVAAEINKMHKK